MAFCLQPAQDLDIRRESPDQGEVRGLLGALDAYLASLYAPEDNHILEVAELMSPDVHFLVARRQGSAVGCAAFRRMAGEPDTDGLAFGEVKRMMVSPEVRGLGVGSALLAALEARMRDDGLRLALLETGAAQHAALRLYRRAGYGPRAAFAGYPDNGRSLFFEKRLGP